MFNKSEGNITNETNNMAEYRNWKSQGGMEELNTIVTKWFCEGKGHMTLKAFA